MLLTMRIKIVYKSPLVHRNQIKSGILDPSLKKNRVLALLTTIVSLKNRVKSHKPE
jgi:hypothetical protein